MPLVELRTTHEVRFVTDNAGLIAFDLPELMGRETWFNVIGQGYEAPKDGFGYQGVRLTPVPGKVLKVVVNRKIIARRIGRLTGGGLFAESQKLGQARDWAESGVLGCDSVQNAIYEGRLFWVWGDTTLAKYPLGIFNSTAAATPARALASFQPPLRLPFDYFCDSQGHPRGVAEIPGEGPTWLTGLVTLPDASGKLHLVTSYMKIKPPLEPYQWGLAAWDDTTKTFQPLRVVWSKSKATPKSPPIPQGHAVFWTDANQQRWVLFGNPFPTLRCPATFDAWQQPQNWEPLHPQATVPAASGQASVTPHTGSIAWNAWRKRWVTVFMEKFGKPSAFGELWYAEADAPTGPWGPAVKVLSHDHYTFYNPRLHPEFTPEDSPVLFFEGTYTVTFSDNKRPTPRYEYNQVLYRLDLDDPALSAAR
ncbi:MAG TPA: hypothetical protein VG146_00960 [Verrucomicrobiae bacterium]|nr:hypothetical protein [Verrucomicrobiae bacterium]